MHAGLQVVGEAEAILQPDDRAVVEREQILGQRPEAPAPQVAREPMGQPEIALVPVQRSGGRQIDQVELDLRRLRRRRAAGVGRLCGDWRGDEDGREEPGGQARAAEKWSGETTRHELLNLTCSQAPCPSGPIADRRLFQQTRAVAIDAAAILTDSEKILRLV